MKTITIWLMRINLKIAKYKCAKTENSIIEHAYRDMIKNYENTIMFLKAQRHANYVSIKNKFNH